MLRNLNTDLTLKNCLFGSVKLTKNADPDKYKYSGYDTGFDSRSGFYIQMQAWEKNVFIFRADTKSSAQDILIICEVQTQRLDGTRLTGEAKYSINFTQLRKRLVFCLHYNGSNNFLLVNATKIY